MDEATDKFSEPTDKSWDITKWLPWYSTVLDLVMAGEKTSEIAKTLNKSTVTINRVRRAKAFKKRISELTEMKEKRHGDAIDILNNYKIEVIQKIVDLIFHAERDSTKGTLATWFMERFPEFSNKNDSTIQNTNVYNVTGEELERQEKVVSDMDAIQKILARGNPNVLEVSENAADFTQEELDKSREDTPDAERDRKTSE